ncbi:TetR/AcrR family transcriptional regulator [Microbacterium sp. P04]|uniref:TetR/AcrR family transcriptional regulator n=1 Tax=Microbacterium sp. P04 TaxID=3366947 RepID=UPI00374617FB
MPDKPAGSVTRDEILKVALDLFTENGFEGTSIRDISTALGMTKSSLYYHFVNKDDIVASLMKDRAGEVDELIEWIEQHAGLEGLLRAAALHWLDRTTPERLEAMRLAQSNQPVIRRMSGSADKTDPFERVYELLLGPNASITDQLHARVVFNAANAVLLASPGVNGAPDDVLTVARRIIIQLTP